MEAESVFFRHPIRVFLISGAILALASVVEHRSVSLLAAEAHARPEAVVGSHDVGLSDGNLSPHQRVDISDRALTLLPRGGIVRNAPTTDRVTALSVSGRSISAIAAPYVVAERVGPASGQGGIAGGPGTACECDSDCEVDGSACTTDVCNLATGLCEQSFPIGTPCRASPFDADGLFCTLGECNGAGDCLDDDLGGSPCDDGAGGTEMCNDTTDHCDGVECTTNADCSAGGANPAQCQANICLEGRCRVDLLCVAGNTCDGSGVCVTVLDGRCCSDLAVCSNTTLAACDNGGGPGSGPWSVGDGSCQCPHASWGHNDNDGAAFPFSITASENCTAEGVAGAAAFNRIGDDYTTINGAHILLESFNFVGGVAGDGDSSVIVEIWDGSVEPPVLVDSQTLTFPQTGNFFWSADYTESGVVAPATGWVTLRPATGGGETIAWFSANTVGAIGFNNENLMWVDNERRSLLQPDAPDVLAFELIGTTTDPTGACCLGQGLCNDSVTGDTNLKVPWLCEDAGGTFVAGESCMNSPCQVATCCFGDGACQVLDPGACIAQGGTIGAFGGTCSPNCCGQVASAGDTCDTAMIKLLDTLTAGAGVPVTARYSGDSSNATNGRCDVTTAQTCNVFVPSGGPEPDSCPVGEFCNPDEGCLNDSFDAGHWEAFEITAASEVRIGYCCSDANDTGAPGARWMSVVDDCALCTKVMREAEALCGDGNLGDRYLLEAGTYHYAIFTSRVCQGTTDACQIDADCDPGVLCFEQAGTYELEIEATMLPFVACCFQNICVDENSPTPVTTIGCEAQGGFELVGVTDCFGAPCLAGACCVGAGNCQDVVDLGSCNVLGGSFIGGANCVIDDPCPICPLDDLDNGGPDCQAANGSAILFSDRNMDPPTGRADDFNPLTGGPLTEICFEAAFRVPGGACCADTGSQMPDSWNVTLFEDDGLIPGAVVGPAGGQILQNVISGVPELCTQTKSGSGLVGISLVAGNCYWMEISGLGEGLIGDPPALGCSTGLLSSLDGNDYMVRGTPGSYTTNDIVTDIFGDHEADFAFCVDLGMGPLCNRDAACCFDPNGPPPSCQVMSPAACLAAGGIFAPGEVCGFGVCPAPCEAETCLDQISLNAPGEPCQSGLPCDRPYTNAFCNNTFGATPCGNQGADAWYTYTTSAVECGDLTISTCGGNFDGFLSVYDGGPNCDCPVDESAPLVCDDDFCGPSTMSQVTFTASADTCYLIRAGGWNADVGAGTLQLSMANIPPTCVATTPEPVLADPAINISGGTLACASDADCTSPNTAVCRNGGCYARKGRFVSVSPNPVNAGMNVALRVCVDAPGPGAHCWWVDAPGAPITHLGPGPQPLVTANLFAVATGTAVYRDWSLDGPDSHGNTVAHIGGCAVSNGHDYYIQAIFQGSDESNEGSYSPALILPTTGAVINSPPTGNGVFGDVNGNTVANIGDVLEVVRGFQNQQELPRTWLKLLPSGNCPADPGDIPVADVLAAVRGFHGQSYEEQPGASAPIDCPPGGGNCGGGGPGGCQVVPNPPVLIQLVPVKASGVEGADWVAGPGPNDITLMHGGQDVAVEVFIENLGANTVAAYQFALDCNYDFSVAGNIDPFAAVCNLVGLPFDSGQCLDVDESRPDYIFEQAAATIIACQTTALCPNGVAGKFVCGAVVAAGSPGSGAGSFYGSTFGFAVSADAEGVAAVGVDLDPSQTLMLDVDGCAYLLENVTSASIIVAPTTGRCCGDPAAPLQCSDGVTLNQCLAVGGGFTAGGVCSGVEGPVPGLDSACVGCTSDAECIDSDPCTDDVCNLAGICTNIQDVRLCCNPDTGAKMLIDDQNICTDDVCNPLTGLVTHTGSATSGVCASAQGSRYISATPPCGLSGACDDTSLVAMSLAVEPEPGVAIELGFVQLDGTVGETAVFQTPSAWGTVQISGGFVRPSTTYTVTLVPMTGLAGGPSSSATTGVYADVDGNGAVNFADIQIVVLVFLGDDLFVDLLGDLNPCVPNHVVNFADIQAVVLAFQGGSFPDACPLGVCCFTPGMNSCGPFNGFGPGAMEEQCPPPGEWTEGGVCGGAAECP